jgi:hypothetical protein
MQKIGIFQLQDFFSTTASGINFTCLFLWKHFKNFRNNNILFTKYSWIIPMTTGTTYGGTTPIHNLSSITFPTKMFSLLLLSSGYGRPDVTTRTKVFSWLLLMVRLNVLNILRRKKHKIEGNNYNCSICSANREETMFHLSKPLLIC